MVETKSPPQRKRDAKRHEKEESKGDRPTEGKKRTPVNIRDIIGEAKNQTDINPEAVAAPS
jgi:hypothetical protein